MTGEESGCLIKRLLLEEKRNNRKQRENKVMGGRTLWFNYTQVLQTKGGKVWTFKYMKYPVLNLFNYQSTLQLTFCLVKKTCIKNALYVTLF